MLSHFPRWIFMGSFALALVAGMVNAIGLLSFSHQAVSHLSGTASQLGVAVASADSYSWHLLTILLSFVAGATVSGLLISSSTLKLGRHYDTLLLIEATLLGLAVLSLWQGSNVGHLFASAACGLQNAMITTFSGAVIRTTHLTGIFTDIGIMLGHRLKGHAIDKGKLSIFLLIIMGFILGSALGKLSFTAFDVMGLVAPALICLLLALAYRIIRGRYYRTVIQ